MVVPGSLNDIVQSLAISVALGGQLITIAAVVMCFGAPLAAGFVAGFDRRRLLVFALLWWAAGHALSRAVHELRRTGAAARADRRRRGDLHAASGRRHRHDGAAGSTRPRDHVHLPRLVDGVGARHAGAFVHRRERSAGAWAFALVAVLSAAAALWVWRAMPDGVKPPPMSLAAWRDVFTHPVLMAIVLVTALSGAGQFTLFSYFAPYFRQLLAAGAAEISFLFFWFGTSG